MHWWQHAFTSISKSQSRDDSVIPSDNGKTSFFSSRRHRLLSRARKLLQPIETADARSVEKSRNQSAARPAAAPSPLPLPLPELHVLLQRDPKSTPAPASGSVPLPSPDTIKVHKDSSEERERDMGREREMETETGEAANGETIADKSQESRRNTEKRERRKQHSKTTSLESYNNIPISAPCSPYLQSPLRNEYEYDMQHYMNTNMNTNNAMGIFQFWSAPEPSSSSRHKHSLSVDNIMSYPLHSPSVSVHPLPLPPAISMPSFPTQVSPVASMNDHFGASLPSQSTPPPPALLSPTETTRPINSKWQKGKLIGRGTFGSVYVASNRETGALCAMKEVEILPDDSKSAECIRQLEQEIKVLSHLKHPNIVQYYGSEIVGDKFYIYLEHVYPGSINKFIHDHCGAITESVVRNFTRHILFGLAYLHGKKTIHRDIKGANLLVDAYGVVKLADFGMAKHLNGQTAYMSMKGSPYWMAPELLQSTMQTDGSCEAALAVDVWSLGCTIIEMMNGKPPWSEYEGAAALFKVLKETPPLPDTMSVEGKDFLQCCFRRNPAHRPSATRLLDHPFVFSSNFTQSNHDIIKENMQFLRDRDREREGTRYVADQVPLPLEAPNYNKDTITNNLSFAAYDSFTPLRIPNAAISKYPI